MVSCSGTGSIKSVSVAHLDSTSQGPYTLVEGQVDSAATAVTLLRSDGDQVQASTDKGWFVAWWPGSQDTTSAEITTASRVTTQTLNTPPPLPSAGSGSCDLNSQSTSSTVIRTGGAAGGGTGGPSTAMLGGEGGANPVSNGGQHTSAVARTLPGRRSERSAPNAGARRCAPHRATLRLRLRLRSHARTGWIRGCADRSASATASRRTGRSADRRSPVRSRHLA
jgi:hypothetical protein